MTYRFVQVEKSWKGNERVAPHTCNVLTTPLRTHNVDTFTYCDTLFDLLYLYFLFITWKNQELLTALLLLLMTHRHQPLDGAEFEKMSFCNPCAVL